MPAAEAQRFSGQWKGEFTDESSKFSGLGGDRCRYVLDLDVKGKTVSGYSYTYFDEDGKTYYTICRLDGYVDTKRKFIEVTEVERTKTNVPVTVRNCFQVHRLRYTQQGDFETMEGSWEPAPKQGGGCGYGNTVLTRRSLSNSLAGYNAPPRQVSPFASKPPADAGMSAVMVTKERKPGKSAISRAIARSQSQEMTMSLTPQAMLVEKEEIKTCATPSRIRSMSENASAMMSKYEKRNATIIRTIEVENSTVKVDIYDNGEIDGDSISVLYDGKLLLTNKRLTGKPICLSLPVQNNGEMQQLVMYAENLGSIPPNTALMVVTDGDKRHEVRITSDLQKSGAINFVQRKSTASSEKK